MTNAIIYSFPAFNGRRYGRPWVCRMTSTGEYDFSHSVGTYTGDAAKGEPGDLVVFNPVPGVVYGYGRKDYNCNKNTFRDFAKWSGEKFTPCDKLGREI